MFPPSPATVSLCHIFDLVTTNNCLPSKISSVFSCHPSSFTQYPCSKNSSTPPGPPIHWLSHSSLPLDTLIFYLPQYLLQIPRFNTVIASQALHCFLGPSPFNTFYPWLNPTLPAPHLHPRAECVWGKNTQSYRLVSLPFRLQCGLQACIFPHSPNLRPQFHKMTTFLPISVRK